MGRRTCDFHVDSCGRRSASSPPPCPALSLALVFLRSFAFGSDTSRTFTAIYGIAGIAAIPFVYFAVDLAQGSTMHPSNPTREGLPPAMGQTAGVGLITFIWIFAWLVARRMEIAALEERALRAVHSVSGA